LKVFPAGLIVEGKHCVVIGGGKVAARKAAALADAGALVTVVAESFCRELAEYEGAECIEASYAGEYLQGAFLVVAATDDGEVNSRAARDARAAGALVNVVDTPGECDFIFPAIARKGDVQAAVSTGGASPALARRLKEEIQGSFDEAYGELAAVLKVIRPRAMESITDASARREFLERLASDEFLAVVKSRGAQGALAAAEELLEDAAADAGERASGP